MLSLIMSFLSSILHFALHIGSPIVFPRPLSQQEEMELIEKMKTGDEKAKTKLIEHNLRLVAHVIKKYYSSCSDQEDLISIGTIGLIKAIDNFDTTLDVKFSTYAVPMNGRW